MNILDPCCGSRMMWADKADPRVVFGDIRHETITVTDRSHGNQSGTRTLRNKPLFWHLSGRKGLTHWLVFAKASP